jgi:hypothetical protein
MPHIIGEDLLARDGNGRLLTRIATIFPRTQTIVTLPGIHATQRLAYIEWINGIRDQEKQPELTEDQQDEQMMQAVDLVLEEDTILIRPDPAAMDLAFEADELLQQIVSKKKIKFLHVLDVNVRQAIERRGERWRMAPLPRSAEEMRRMIASSKIGIGGREIYYYNKSTGTRILTYQEYCQLAGLGDGELRRLLEEIGQNCSCSNRLGCPEVDFFMTKDHAIKAAADRVALDVASNPQVLRSAYESLRQQFFNAVPPEFHHDDLQSPEWRSQMFAALIGHTDKEVSEEAMLGLSAEFFMQVEWLPGGRAEDGELLLDQLFDEEVVAKLPEDQRVTDERARGFIFNFIRDYGDLEFINIGRVVTSLSTRDPLTGRRGVYLAEIKHRGAPRPILRIIRMQKFGVREHLDEGRDMLTAIMQSDEYTDYILDRRLGCRQLGMNLSSRTAARKVGERYLGSNLQFRGQFIRSPYFERDYLSGLATDKIGSWRFGNEQFALRFARLLGRAAAPNLITGRSDLQGKVIFDDGDELLVEDGAGLPIDIVVADHTGTFGDYQRDLIQLAPAYALPVNKRAMWLPNPRAFADVFIQGFVERFAHIQREYRRRKRAFDTLFKHQQRDEGGSFSYRWERVLQRLDASDSNQLAQRIAQSFTGV